MWIQTISLNNYRNYQGLELEFSPGLNLFIGQNAQGKTNLLEAIYFLALTRSHRTRHDKELIQFNQQEASLKGTIHRQSGSLPMEIQLSDRGRVTKINHLKQSRLSQYIGHMTVVLFAPEDLQLVKGSPSLRRKFIDIDLGQIKPLYLSDLSQYNHVLKQRNTYLKTANPLDEDYLSVLDEQLADYGSRVMLHRQDFIKKLEEEANTHFQRITNKKEDLGIGYKSSVIVDNSVNIKESFVNQLVKNRKIDLLKKSTSLGPHRDDMVFFIKNMNATFGSQGQHRSLILSLKMAEIDLIKESNQESPILLLDDVMSELDEDRQTQLIQAILAENVQTFMTTTSLDHLSHLPEDLSIYKVEAGNISQ